MNAAAQFELTLTTSHMGYATAPVVALVMRLSSSETCRENQ